MEIFKPTIQDQATFSGSVDISGSLTITQNLNVVGGLQGAATTASYISLANVDGFADVSSSIEQRISRQESFSQSLDSTFATDQQVSDAVSSLNAATSSYALQADISGSFTSVSESLAGRITSNESSVSALNSASSSYLLNTTDTLTGTLTVTNVVDASSVTIADALTHKTDTHTRLEFASDQIKLNTSGSTRVNITNSGVDIFDGLNMNSTKITQVQDPTSAQDAATKNYVDTSVSSLNSVTSSYLLNTTDTLDGDLTVTGTLTAQTLHVQEVTSSVVYSSGSNRFGEDASDVHQFTGSIKLGTDSDLYISRTLYASHIDSGASNTLAINAQSGFGIIDLGSTYTQTSRLRVNYIDSGLGTGSLRIANDGNVGIGAVSPVSKFHVLGTTKLEGDTTVAGGTLTTTSNINAGGSITAAASGYIELKADQTDTAAVRLGVSSGALEAFVIADNTGAGHIVGNTSFKVMGYASSTLTEYARFTSTGLGIKLATPSNNFQVGGDLNADNSAVWFGGGYVDNSLYHYADAPVGISGRWGASGDNGAGITLMARNGASTNWYHGYISLKRDGNFYIGMNGLGTAQASDQVVLQRDGNVGIGTTSPAAKLDVRAGSGGKMIFGSYDANYNVTIQGGNQIDFYNGATAANGYINYLGNGTGLSQNLFVEKGSAGTTGNVRINSSGNVGIGETSPAAKLHIRDTGGGILRLDRNDTSGATGEVLGKVDFWGNDFSGTGYDSRGFVQVAYQDAFARTYMSFGTGTYNQTASEKMRITSDGDVGIGTTNPSGKVHVVSDITSNSGMTNHNGAYTHSVSGVKPGSTSQKLRVFVGNYSTGLLNFSYAHTNSGSCGASLLVYINNSYGIIATNTIHSDLTFCQGTISISTYSPGGGASGAFYEITMPTGNGSPAYWAATITGAGNFYFNVI